MVYVKTGDFSLKNKLYVAFISGTLVANPV
jgi:hypothetical protein